MINALETIPDGLRRWIELYILGFIVDVIALFTGDKFLVTQSDIAVSGAGSIDPIDGNYIYTTTVLGKPLYNLEGQTDTSTDFAIFNTGQFWRLNYASTEQYIGSNTTNAWDAVWGTTSIIVDGAGTAAVNGSYSVSGNIHNGRPYFCLAGDNPVVSAISWSGTAWEIWNAAGTVAYGNGGEDVALPQRSVAFAAGVGSNPAPTVADSDTPPMVSQSDTVKRVSREIGNIGFMARPVMPTVTAAGTTTLFASDIATIQQFTGATTQNVLLPVVSDFLTTGNRITVFNDSTGVVTVKSSGGNVVLAMAAGSRADFYNLAITGTGSAVWDYTSSTSGTAPTSGVYTPALTNTTNLAASTAFECQYMRVGNTVTVSGKVAVDPTASGAALLEISLPIPSNFAAEEDCGGVAFATGIAGQGAGIVGNIANDTASMKWIAADITNQPMCFTFTYQVI